MLGPLLLSCLALPALAGTLDSDSRPRIHGGTDAEPGEFPHQVMVTIDGVGLWCSGSLLAPSVVVTSAYCCTM